MSRDPERPWNDWLEPAGSDDAGALEAGPLPGPRIRTVAELTRLVRDRLRDAPGLHDAWVEGEIGQVSVSAAGHAYLTLKDERAQLRCVIFREDRQRIPFVPQTGLRVVVHGRIDVFEQGGAYQFYVDALQPAGHGDLALRLEAIKAKLAAEGLFEAARKRPLPPWPTVVGVVTSETGAVLHDILHVLRQRWPRIRVLFAPCLVQGDTAPATILGALRRVGRWTDPATGRAVDLVILARGGGSLEDLWPFNDERVVRAVAAFPRPVIVGVGHETDVTLVEFAADVRAATPSLAAELAVPSRDEQAARLTALRLALVRAGTAVLTANRAALDAERRALDGLRPSAVLSAERERIGLLLDRAARAMSGRLARDGALLTRSADRLPVLAGAAMGRARTELDSAARALGALSPFATLERGYAIVRRPDGSVVRSAAQERPGDPLDVRLAEGTLDVRVERVRDSGP
ncbi:MAG: exodeoxyribonuclease VII large subunit [Candidatus Limnocylindrales bacterium]